MSTSATELKPVKFTLKTPKGTRDFTPPEMALRNKIFKTITNVFETHGAIDTPVFELREILSGKYGEDSKLIYDLEDQGGELTSLRYDLTVPFARFIAQTGKTYQNIKRYHIAKVYRRDQPSLAKGRMREFYQCDFDIAGTYDSMIPDSEAIMVMVTILDRLNVGKFQVKVNHRKILDGMFQICGVPESLTRQISSAVDKLDKMPWNLVKQEMIEKGLDEDCADKIGVYVKMNGTSELLDKLLLDESFSTNETTLAGLNDLKLLSSFLTAFGISDFIKFDLSLARGLDYYTGVIYEAVVLGGDVGSVASGGRYDNLVGMFSGGATIPCVGISIGVERVYALLAKKELENKSSIVQVYVCGLGSGTLIERMKICKELWSSGISASFQYKTDVKLDKQFKICERDHIPIAIMIGSREIERGVVGIKVQKEDSKQFEVSRADLVEELKKLLIF